MAKITLNKPTSGYNLAAINENFTRIEAEFQDKVLYRNNPVGEANTLQTDVDVNSKRLYNLGAPQQPNDAARFGDIPLTPIPIGTTTALLTSFAPTANISAINVQAAIEELDSEKVRVDSLASASGAGLVGWIRNAIGAVGSTLLRWMGLQPISVTDFMTEAQIVDVRANTALVDVTAAIQSAITHVALIGGGQLRFPEGTYRISSVLNISGNNIHCLGAGRKATKILQVTAGAGVFTTTKEYFTLDHMAIEYLNQGTIGGVAVNISGAFYSTIDDIYIKKAYIGFSYNSGANSHQVTRWVCEDSTSSGILISTAANVMSSTFQILNSNTTLCALGCIRLVDFVEGCNFVNGHTFQGVFSLVTGAAVFSVGLRPAYNKFHAVYFDASSSGAVIDKAIEFDFTDCWFSTRPGNGAVLTTCRAIRFTGGGAVNCAKHGILVENTAVRVLFVNFSAGGNSTELANTYSGITFAAGTTHFSVTSCTCTSADLSFGTQKYGIEILVGASNSYILAHNIVTGNGVGGILDGGTGTTKSVKGNIGYNNAQRGALLLASGTSTSVVPHGLNVAPISSDIIVSALSDISLGGVTRFWVSAADATNFTFNSNAVATNNLFFTWDVRTAGAQT